MPQSPLSSRRPRESDPVFRREMRERWRRPLTPLQLALFAFSLAWLAFQFYSATVPAGDVTATDVVGKGREFFLAVARLHLLAWVPGGLLLAAPALSAERERGHLADWVLAGLTPDIIVRAKFRALAGFVLVLVCVPFPILALCFPLGGVAPGDMLATGALTVVVALNSTALGLMISASSARVASAMGNAILVGAIALAVGGPILALVLAAPWPGVLAVAALMAIGPVVWAELARDTFAHEVNRQISGDTDLLLPLGVAGPRLPFADKDGILTPIPTPLRAIAPPPANTRPLRAALRESRLFSDTERRLLELAAPNAVAHRELLLRFKRRGAGSDELYQIRWQSWLVLWLCVGVAGLAWPFVLRELLMDELGWLRPLIKLIFGAAMVQTALSAAPGFTRERAQRMLSALQMTTLSAREIVGGKAAACLLGCAHFFAGPLLALGVMALWFGPQSALMTIVAGVACVTLTAVATLTLSLWSRRTEIVASGALIATLGVWWAVPTLYLNFNDVVRAPAWLRWLWLKPMALFERAQTDAQLALALVQLSLVCAIATIILGALCARQLQKTRAEDESSSWLQRDLSRHWH